MSDSWFVKHHRAPDSPFHRFLQSEWVAGDESTSESRAPWVFGGRCLIGFDLLVAFDSPWLPWWQL